MKNPFKVSQIWRMFAIFLIGMLCGAYLIIKLDKISARPSNSTTNNTEINIDKIKNSDIATATPPINQGLIWKTAG